MKIFYLFLSIIFLSTNCFAEIIEFRKCYIDNYKSWEDYQKRAPNYISKYSEHSITINLSNKTIIETKILDEESMKIVEDFNRGIQEDAKKRLEEQGIRIDPNPSPSKFKQSVMKLKTYSGGYISGEIYEGKTILKEGKIFINIEKAEFEKEFEMFSTELPGQKNPIKIDGERKNINEKYKCESALSSGDEEASGSSGTAFFINYNGYLLTNNHVVEGCKISKISYKGKNYKTKLIATDKTLDLALLKSNVRPKNFISFSDESAEKLNKIYVAGYPLGKGLSDDLKISSGIISSLKGLNDNSNEIQIDAPINPGNSGGPIINNEGELVGIAVSGLAKDLTEGINFGVKSSAAESFLRANKIKPNKSVFSNTKRNSELLKILENSTVYTYCEQ